MWKYVDLEKLSDAKDGEKIVASYAESKYNKEGYKDDLKMRACGEDCRKGRCRLLVWRNILENDSGFNKTIDMNVEQIITRYENAKQFAKLYKDNKAKQKEYLFEMGRAFALEGVLRMFGYDYSEIALSKDIDWEV